MPCKLLERDQVPAPPTRVLNGAVDEGDQRWRFRDGLLTIYIRYLPEDERTRGELPWVEMWSGDDVWRAIAEAPNA